LSTEPLVGDARKRSAGGGELLASCFRNFWSRQALWNSKMITLKRRAALIAFASCAASSANAQTSRPQNAEFVTFERPAVFEIAPNTGSLKESVQKGQ
jgi:hypothetical protein